IGCTKVILIPAQRSKISQDRESHAFWDGKKSFVAGRCTVCRLVPSCDGSCRAAMACAAELGDDNKARKLSVLAELAAAHAQQSSGDCWTFFAQFIPQLIADRDLTGVHQ